MSAATVIALIPSSSNPSKSYEVRLGGDGNVYCTCPAWKFQKLPPKERTCKHMKGLSAQIAQVTAKLAKAAAPKAAPVKVPAPAPVVAAAPVAPAPVPVVETPKADPKVAKLALAQAKVKAAQAALALAQAEVELAEALAA